MFEYASFFFSPSAVPCSPSKPGSLKYTYSLMIMAWIDKSTCSKVETLGSQFSDALPLQVPNKLKHTLPHA